MEKTKPFNLDAARAGAPYACRDGREATILKWESRRDGFPLLGVYSDRDLPGVWRADGSNSGNRDLDLVMTPLGYIDGKPVFAGDKVVVRGTNTEYVASPRDIAIVSAVVEHFRPILEPFMLPIPYPEQYAAIAARVAA